MNHLLNLPIDYIDEIWFFLFFFGFGVMDVECVCVYDISNHSPDIRSQYLNRFAIY